MAAEIPMPGENLAPKVSQLMGDIASLNAKLRQVNTLLDQYKPTFLQIKDINGKLRRYTSLAKFSGTASDLNYGLAFEIKDVSKNGQPRIAVYKHSSLRKSLRANDRLIITGLDDGMGNGDFAVAKDEVVYIEIDVQDGVAQDARIEHRSGGWDGFPEPVKFEGSGDQAKQTKAFIAIAKIVEFEETLDNRPPGLPLPGNLMVSQYLNSHLVMLDTCYGSVQCVYPFPHAGPVLSS